VLARRGIQAGIRKQETLDRFAADDVRLDNLIDIGFSDMPVPDSFGIDHQVWAVLALIEASRLVRANFAFETTFGQLLLE
jgi:hypothetical protein